MPNVAEILGAQFRCIDRNRLGIAALGSLFCTLAPFAWNTASGAGLQRKPRHMEDRI